MTMDESTLMKSKRRKYACVECRQQKSKCDYTTKFPEPCSRCKKKGIICAVKQGFKRTKKRATAEAIERKIEQLKNHIADGPVSVDDLIRLAKEDEDVDLGQFDNTAFTREQLHILRSEARTPVSRAMTPLTNALNTTVNNGLLSRSLSAEECKCSPKSLGDIYMSSEDIADLFQEFATNYHQFLPVVDLSKGAEKIFSLSPCLFWVIMLTGLRHRSGSIETMTKLSTLVKSILAEITISPIIQYTPTESDEPLLNVASVYSVQAFLLYTFWPPLTSSLSTDTSWNTIGTAMFQAIRVGLNCADFSKDYATANPTLISEQLRTWLCCNIVSQIVASSFGFPAYVSFDHSIITSTDDTRLKAKEHGLVIELRQMSHIVHFESQVQETLHSNPGKPNGLVDKEEQIPLIMVLNQQLDTLESTLLETQNLSQAQPKQLDDIRMFLLLVAKVHLLTYYFMNIGQHTEFETKRGLVKVYNAAIALLEYTNDMCDRDPNVIKYFPGVFVLNIWQSACIVSKLLFSSLISILDVEKCREIYVKSVEFTSTASIIKHDTAYRFSGIMRSIWSMFQNLYDQAITASNAKALDPDFNLKITVKSRMSVSVFFDCLYILKKNSGRAKLKRKLEEDVSAERRAGTNDGRSSDPDDARTIIKTTPLDPSPINAGSSGTTGNIISSSDSKGPSSILSLESVLNKVSPLEQNPYVPPSAEFSHLAREGNSPLSKPALAPQRDIENTEGNNEIMSDSWENWQSDMVWKDVDMLLNEFAFNPTL
ncbi:uncharacterized protein KNAG_0F03720 [Huiozyma naganishii CBS 8797]|uniref:Zn(2)-C6 fungal-type domain-containing protein n=1 Tax=Huiozyma naganishii (strain ATCC MYA-139 / BCRC 22969 / CBS 8797 / KCTC 17520 / NBRC 10181 / NCYC 3082 / Yp74L-3) TaxID=1071383 RepID=J7S7L7_HUIN7|nr:hypothetical protein KNAG_0F03720 [Kazachstania naganishii CBS 8797]CCK71034.1 hypothetical protein KNAG_0F03720 [Kazachstania naganishii CBS 8797]